jgi:hypothetical protein
MNLLNYPTFKCKEAVGMTEGYTCGEPLVNGRASFLEWQQFCIIMNPEWIFPRACRPVAFIFELNFRSGEIHWSPNDGPLPHSVTCLHSASCNTFSHPCRACERLIIWWVHSIVFAAALPMTAHSHIAEWSIPQKEHDSFFLPGVDLIMGVLLGLMLGMLRIGSGWKSWGRLRRHKLVMPPFRIQEAAGTRKIAASSPEYSSFF